MAKVYVAGKSNPEEIRAVRAAQAMLEAGGHQITYDWTPQLEPTKQAQAEADFNGVFNADAVLLLNHQDGCGLFTELGFATAWGKPVFVVGREVKENFFFNLKDVYCYVSVEDAVQAIGEWADEHREVVQANRDYLR